MTMSRMANSRPTSLSSHRPTRRRLLAAGLTAGLAAFATPGLAQASPFDPERTGRIRPYGDPDFQPVKFKLPAPTGTQGARDDRDPPGRPVPAGSEHAEREAGADDQPLVPGAAWPERRRSRSTCRQGPRSRWTTRGRVSTGSPCRAGRSTSRTPTRMSRVDVPMQRLRASRRTVLARLPVQPVREHRAGGGSGQPRVRRRDDGPLARDAGGVPGRAVRAGRVDGRTGRSGGDPEGGRDPDRGRAVRPGPAGTARRRPEPRCRRQASLPAGLADGLDLRKVGMFGFSLGGYTAANTMLEDERVLAGLDLDGTLQDDTAQGTARRGRARRVWIGRSCCSARPRASGPIRARSTTTGRGRVSGRRSAAGS